MNAALSATLLIAESGTYNNQQNEQNDDQSKATSVAISTGSRITQCIHLPSRDSIVYEHRGLSARV
ncbi:hypothetical protein GCM10007968_31490 [Sporolactobacillus putidus]|uniref:Uncharacterized protein n=1 Tax=Sporolactobacillus putidus TaxID=492735 RepID=A0A917SAX6_9BACL|nr:hypothetical protein GCM10007968_31490 [Sporolactobacillus putidus]